MYRKVLCDWFLSDGIHPRVRLDAPGDVEQALLACGVLREGQDYEARQAQEWIYRRRWRYEAEFTLPGGDKRAFLRLTGLNGRWKALVNGAEAASGEADSAEFEITALLQTPNRIELVFEPDASGRIRPAVGFAGMLSYRLCGCAAICEASFSASEKGARVFTALSLSKETKCELEYRLKNDAGEFRSVHRESPGSGHTPLMRELFEGKLQAGLNTVSIAVKADGEMSDERELSLYLPLGDAPGRGFAGKSEALMGLGEGAGANAAFHTGDEPDEQFALMAARHHLAVRALKEEESLCAQDALLSYDSLMELAGSENALNSPALWMLTDSSSACLRSVLERVPSGSVEAAVALSRYEQACALRQKALDRRLRKQPFALKGALDDALRPASCAIADSASEPRPAYYALLGAWQPEYAFVRLPERIPEDGVLSAEVCYTADWEESETRSVLVNCYGMDGRELQRARFAASALGCVGRFMLEIPDEGCILIRTRLMLEDEELTVCDELALKPGVFFENLPQTQLLPGESRVRNAGKNVALGVTVPGANYFGCLLPGESVTASRGEISSAEGLNIYF